MAYKLDSYVDAYETLRSKSYNEIKNDPELYIMFAMFVSHCFNGYNPSVFQENCSTCEHTHLARLRNEGYEAAVNADLLNSKDYRLKNSELQKAFWVNNSNELKVGFNLSDENVNELVSNGLFHVEHFEFCPAEWFSVSSDQIKSKKSK